MVEFNLNSDFLNVNALKYDTKIAIIDGNRQWSYRELNDYVGKCSAFLCNSGIEKGDKIGILQNNSNYFPVGMISIFSVSGVMVPIGADLTDEDISGILTQHRPRFILTDRPNRLSGLIDPAVTTCIQIKDCLEENASPDGLEMDLDSAAYITPSGAITHQRLHDHVAETLELHKFNPSSRLLATLPFASDDSYGMLLAALVAGATVETAASEMFNPDVLAKRLCEGDISHLSAGTKMFEEAAEIICATETDRPLMLGSIHLADGECLEDLRRRFRLRVPNNRIHPGVGPSREKYPPTGTVHLDEEFARLNIITEYISYFAQRNAMAIAIKGDNHSLSYGELETKINSFAYFLESLGFEKNDRIAIYLENSIEYSVAIFGIFKKSCLYVPIPYNDPQERIEEILEDCKPKMLISRKNDGVFKLIDPMATKYAAFIDVEAKEDLPAVKDGVTAFLYKDCFQENKSIECPNRDPKSLAYIIYTSGSTGKPKGVTIRHESLMNYVREAVVEFDYDGQTNAMSESPFHFDGSFSALFAPMYVGGTNVIFKNRFMLPREFILMLIKNKVTHLSCVPSFFAILVENATPQTTPYIRLKTIALGGEDCQLDHIKRIKQMIPKVRIYNQYGPTETCDVICGFEIGMEFIQTGKKVPIGKPYKQVSMHAFNEDFTQIGVNDVGEMYLGGTQVMERYWNDQALTGEKLKTDIIPGKTLYKTGDLVTITEEGDYVFIDRADNMINKYGNRIYLSEIENTLSELPNVKEALCLFIKERGASDIVAFAVLNEDLSREQLREVVKNKLPEYMIPNYFMILDAIPYLSNGKVDRNKLQQCYLDETGEANAQEPLPTFGNNGNFARLSEIIRSIAQGQNIELTGQINLGESLGFDSMMLLRLIMEIEKEYGIQFQPDEVDLENFLTIDRITALLESRDQ